jgi:hypothetical protein
MKVDRVFLILLGVIAVAGITAGCVLAFASYSSAGAFAVASACVGVLGTLAAQKRNGA